MSRYGLFHVARVDQIVDDIVPPYQAPHFDDRTVSPHDYLLHHVRSISGQIAALTEARRYLFAYARHLTNGRPYTLAALAEAAEMPVQAVHTAYDDEIVFDTIVLLAGCNTQYDIDPSSTDQHPPANPDDAHERDGIPNDTKPPEHAAPRTEE